MVSARSEEHNPRQRREEHSPRREEHNQAPRRGEGTTQWKMHSARSGVKGQRPLFTATGTVDTVTQRKIKSV